MEVEIQSTYFGYQTPKARPVTTSPSKEQSKRSQKRKSVKLTHKSSIRKFNID